MWNDFFAEARSRVISPFKYPQFLGYFIFCILIVGALGVNIKIWDYLFNNGKAIAIPKEMATYLIAIIGSSVLDLNLSQKIRHKESFLIYSLILLSISIVIVFLINHFDNIISYVFAILGAFIAWFAWWFANADNLLLTRIPPKPSKDDVTGGNPERNLPGTIKGFVS